MAIAADARKISPQEAQQAAIEFLNADDAAGYRPMRLAKKAEAPAEAQPYYVFNASDDGGFVIVSGDDRAKKILGYSDTGSFDINNVPPQLAALLEQYASSIGKLTDGQRQDPSWKGSQAPVGGGVLLPTATWGQLYPYNGLCPIIDGVQAPAGCVATAMAIVMKYHNWPEEGFGKNVYFSQSSNDYEHYNYYGVVFDWGNMRDSYDEESPEASKLAVSTLMHAAGHSVEMEYRPWESGASFEHAYHALRYHFRYSNSCEYIHIGESGIEEWKSVIRQEIDENRPVIYQGSGIGNHAFVCDGYDCDDFFHFNWGWNGLANGYFLLSALDPEYYNFSFDQSMIKGIQPDESWEELSPLYVDPGYLWFEQYVTPGHGAYITVENIKKGEPFRFFCDYLVIPAGFAGKYGIALTDGEGNIKEVIAERARTNGNVGKAYDNVGFDNCIAGVDPEKDDYIQLVAKSASDDDWLLVQGDSKAPSKVKATGSHLEKAHLKIIVDDPSSPYFHEADGSSGISPGAYDYYAGFKIMYHCDRNSLISSGYPNHHSTIIISQNGKKTYEFERVRDGQIVGAVYMEKGDNEIRAHAAELMPKSVDTAEPGTLESLIAPINAIATSALAINGPIDASDLNYIKTVFGYLENLDLSKAEIYNDEGSKESILPLDPFSGMNYLKYVNLPAGLTKISSKTFFNSAVTAVNIPVTVEEIESNAFVVNNGLTHIMVHWPNPIEIPADCFCYFDYSACTLYVPAGSIDLYREHGEWGKFGNIVEKEEFDIAPVTYALGGIRYRLYASDYTAEVVGVDSAYPKDILLPEAVTYGGELFAVTSIGYSAFMHTDIESVTMPNSIEELGEHAFSECSSLAEVKISSSIKVIPIGCFYGTALQEIALPENLELIAFGALSEMPYVKSLHIPAHAYLAENSIDGMSSCSTITVDDNNPYYVAIDNILYSKDKKKVIFVAGGIEGKVEFLESVEKLPYSCLFYKMPNLTEIEIPRLKELTSMFVNHCPRIKHIVLPDEVVSAPGGEFIADCDSLESITLGRDFEIVSGIHRNPRLTTIYLRNEKIINIPYIFDGDAGFDGMGYYVLDFYTDQISKNVAIDDCKAFYVPGGCKEQFDLPSEKVHELWRYAIDRTRKLILIDPADASIAIDRVAINGAEVEPTGALYPIDDTPGIDVVVDFTLHGRQGMTTHYTHEFNAEIEDEDLSGISGISLDADIPVRIYSPSGILLFEGKIADANLKEGIYIIVAKDGVRKRLIK